MTAYRELEQRFRRLGAIEQAISVLHWDTAAIMPAGGAAARAEQLATLRLIALWMKELGAQISCSRAADAIQTSGKSGISQCQQPMLYRPAESRGCACNTSGV